MKLCFSFVKLVFDILHHLWVSLNYVDELANFFILLLQVISQCFIMSEQLLILLIQGFQFTRRLGEVTLLLLLFAL